MRRRWRWFAVILFALFGSAVLLSYVFSDTTAERSGAEAVIAEAESRLSEHRSAAAVSSSGTQRIENDGGGIPAGMEKAAETGQLALYVNMQTTEFAVKHKPSGMLWRSNPERREEDPLASGQYKERLSSLFAVSYYSSSHQEQMYNSYTDSVKHGQFEIEKLENGVRMIFTVGERVRGLESIPQIVSKERFEERILGQLTDPKQINEMNKRFRYDPEKEVYTRRELTPLAQNAVLRILEQIGYGEEDLAIDNEEHGIASAAGADQAQFVIPLELRLNGDWFEVRLDASEAESLGSLPLAKITLLEYFGAAGTDQTGYILVPDGSGALIRLNNGKSHEPPFIAPVYGEELALQKDAQLTVNETVRLPVFGMKQGEAAWLGVIEEGAAVASIKADVAGRLNSYNYVAPEFTLVSKDDLVIQGGGTVSRNPVYQDPPYTGHITVRYGFLSGEEADYAGMAKLYRSELIAKYDLEPLTPAENLPFLLELVGGVESRRTFLGVPYKAVDALTTYDQALDIVDQLRERQVEDIKLRFAGWFNGGVRHGSAGSLRFDGAVGKRDDFLRFAEELRKRQVGFYPDVSFLKVYREGGGFRASKDAVRYLSKEVAAVYSVDMPTFMLEKEDFHFYPLAPVRLPGVVHRFLAEAEKLGMDGIALRDLGEGVYSDFDPNKPVNRQQAAAIIESQLIDLSAAIPNVLISGGNAYSVAYADTIVNAPMSSSGFHIEDETVPFYQMVLHGYFDLAGEPFNQSLDQSVRKNVLKAIETGSNVYYRWTYHKPGDLSSKDHQSLYSNRYRDWLEEAVESYREVNEALRAVRHLAIEDHEKLAEGVYRTKYEDGTTIIVNYNDAPVSAGDVTVEASSYWMGGR